MCQIESLRQLVIIEAIFKAIMGIYILYTGATFVSSLPIQQAYSVDFLSIGGNLIAIGLFSTLLVFPLVYGVRKHNRFVLISCFFLDTIFMAQLISYGVSILDYTTPIFPKELQLDCLLNSGPLVYSEKECQAFLSHDRTAGFRLLWAWLYSTQKDPLQFQIMVTVEIDNSCCGFFSPMRCSNITDSMPAGHPLTDIRPDLVKMKLECGNYPGYYTQQADCVTIYDNTVRPPIIGGCNYDLGVGPCLNDLVEPTSQGCASAVEDYAATLVTGFGTTLIGASFINLIAMLFACCMWWKRKSSDVFPNFLREARIGVIERDYTKVRDQFEVKSKEHYLQLKSFMPKDKYSLSNDNVIYIKHDEIIPKKEETEEIDLPIEENKNGEV